LALRLLTTLVGSASVLLALPAGAQTWADQRTTPGTSELVAVDKTGEPSWLFGSEDVANDGTGTFNAAEQAADVRSAYAATDDRRLWLRVYVSARTAPEALRVFAFIDTDDNPATGGPAQAPEVDPSLDADAAAGSGYEIALAWTGTSFVGAWRWTPGNGNGSNASAYRPLADLEPLHAVTEGGTDLDPLKLNAAANGYVQLALDIEPIQLSVRCDANLLFRSTSGSLRDRDLGRAGPCVPGDANDNGLADVAEPDDSCTTDSQCPAGGSCKDAKCVAPAFVLAPGCQDANCVAPEFVLAPGEQVQGGALTCGVSAPLGAHPRWFAVAALGVLLGASRLRRLRRGRGAC
jgi:hypothetical protein